MQKTLIFFNEYEANRAVATLEESAKTLQAFVSEFCNLGQDLTLTSDQIIPLLEKRHTALEYDLNRGGLMCDHDKLKLLLIDKLFPGGSVNGVAIHPDMVEKVFNIPPLDTPIALIRKCSIPTLDYLENGYLTISGNLVVIADGAIEKIEESFRFYIENEAEQLRYDKASNLADALNELSALLPEPISETGDLELVVELNSDGKFVANPEFVKSGRAGQTFKFIHSVDVRGQKPAFQRQSNPEEQYVHGLIDAASGGAPKPEGGYSLNEFYNLPSGDE